MNRIFVRLMGFCVTILGVNTARPTATYAGIQEKLPDNCTTIGRGIAYDNFIYGNVSCRMTPYGFVSYNVPRPSECTGTSGMAIPFGKCAGGWCNDTGIFCEDSSDYFKNQNCGDNDAIDGGYGKDCVFSKRSVDFNVASGYFFMECKRGFYEVLGGGTGWFYDLSRLSTNCAPCSGMQFENGGFETYPSPGMGFNSGFEWYSYDVDIDSCRAETRPGAPTSFTNTMGAFELTGPCPYVK